MARQCQDWIEFFRDVARPHGVRIRLANFNASAPEGPRTEKRLVRIVRARPVAEPFALRRSYASGPTIIDCVFTTVAEADDLAGAIGAAPIKPPLGWATARELVADDGTLRRLLKLGAEAPRRPVAKASKDERPAPSIPPIIPSIKPEVITAQPDAVSEARSRLGKMSLEEQAAALFRSMLEGP